MQQLLRLRASNPARLTKAQWRERLDAVLGRFEDALTQPPANGFR